MALIICPECGKSISDKAAKCPACGCPISNNINSNRMNNSPKKFKISIIGVIILCAVIICVWIFSPKEIIINEEEITLTIDETFTIQYTIIPNKSISFKTSISSSDTSIVSINNGILEAKSAGDCQIIVSTWNGKVAKCKVHVMTKEDKHKKCVNMLREYIKENADETSAISSIKQIYSLANDTMFMIAESENTICLMYQENHNYGNDLTMILLYDDKTKYADVSRVSTFVFDGEVMSTTSKGEINLGKYTYGDSVVITNVYSENTPSDFELGVTKESQKAIDNGTENAVRNFDRFLKEKDQYGNISDYGFNLMEE